MVLRVLIGLQVTQVMKNRFTFTYFLSAPNGRVIPTGAKRSGGICSFLPSFHPSLNGSATLLFVIPTEACELQAHDHSVRALQSVSV